MTIKPSDILYSAEVLRLKAAITIKIVNVCYRINVYWVMFGHIISWSTNDALIPHNPPNYSARTKTDINANTHKLLFQVKADSVKKESLDQGNTKT